jgi:hypothetical protein
MRDEDYGWVLNRVSAPSREQVTAWLRGREILPDFLAQLWRIIHTANCGFPHPNGVRVVGGKPYSKREYLSRLSDANFQYIEFQTIFQ